MVSDARSIRPASAKQPAIPMRVNRPMPAFAIFAASRSMRFAPAVFASSKEVLTHNDLLVEIKMAIWIIGQS